MLCLILLWRSQSSLFAGERANRLSCYSGPPVGRRARSGLKTAPVLMRVRVECRSHHRPLSHSKPAGLPPNRRARQQAGQGIMDSEDDHWSRRPASSRMVRKGLPKALAGSENGNGSGKSANMSQPTCSRHPSRDLGLRDERALEQTSLHLRTDDTSARLGLDLLNQITCLLLNQ